VKRIYSAGSSNFILSLTEAKTLHSCLAFAVGKLDDWEYPIIVGASKEEVLELVKSLRDLIQNTGAWGLPSDRK
jgi:hypothetical protein